MSIWALKFAANSTSAVTNLIVGTIWFMRKKLLVTEMNQIERIEHFEKIFDETSTAIENLSDALEKYAAVQEKYFELMNYYGSGWLKDYESDEA